MIDVDLDETLGAFRLAVRFAVDAPVVGLFGRSGAGKTSVINAIAGIGPPARGHVRVNGTTLFDSTQGIALPPDARRVGYVFQDALLFPHLDVEANLLYGQRRRRPGERFIEAARVVDLLGLAPLLRRKPRALSGGEKQRVAIGRALLAQPRLLLMDEPLAALDVARKQEILAYIERLHAAFAIPIVYVSHSVAEIVRLADTVVVLEGGRVAAIAEGDDIEEAIAPRGAGFAGPAETLVAAEVRAHDRDLMLTTLAFAGGTLQVPLVGAAAGARVTARIRARDVALALARPVDISVLNILPGRVAAVHDAGGASVDVDVAIGGILLTSRVSRRSLRDLDLAPGRAVHALIKAVALDELSVGRD